MSKTIRVADLFCGAGGTSTGLMRAAQEQGRPLDLVAVNHWQMAIDTHASNHPGARHYCAVLEHVDPREAVPSGRLDLLVASPECVFHSRARGGRPINDQRRASAWHVLRWLELLYVERVLIENVAEFQDWGPLGANDRPLKSKKGEIFRAFIAAIEALGYRVKWRILNAADYGDPTTRQRLFIIARRGRGKLEWPEPTHCRDGASTLFGALPRWRAAREVIDWSLQGESIFNRKRPLKPRTMQRIFAGLRKLGGVAFTMPITHHGGDRCNALEVPLPTITGANRGEQALTQPFLVPVNYSEREGQAPRSHSIDAPMPTVVGGSTHAVVQPFLVTMREGNERRGRSVNEPVPTITAGGKIVGLAQPFVLGQQSGAVPRDTDQPLPTIATGGAISLIEPFLVQYHGGGRCVHPIHEPLRTVDTRDRYALVTVNGTPALLDVRFRMLQPHELAAAMSFPKTYQFRGNRQQIVRQIGNAVPVQIAYELCRALL